jgi:hypothetical protein
MQWVMAAALICSSTVFTSCTKQDNPVNPADNLAEMLLGKWMPAEWDGQLLPTNKKLVYTFVSSTKAYMSASFAMNQNIDALWSDQTDGDVVIEGNKVTLTFHINEHHKGVEEYTITSINDSEFTAYQKVTVTIDGTVRINDERTVRLTKLTTDYRDAIVGTWEGRCTSEGSIFDDGKEHRWEYKADGTYVYYVKDGDNWVPYATNTLNEYFVDGNLLCTRWIDNGVENREWWEITIADGKMNWTALRENSDRTTFTATFEMKKVE